MSERDPAYDRIGSPEELASRIDCQKAKDGKTIQSMRDECDINKIVARYGVAELQLMATERGPGQYLDVSEVGDYRQAMEQVRRTDEFFRQLPAEVRASFGNDPAFFLDYMSEPMNKEDAIRRGLLPAEEKPEEATPGVATPVVPPTS